LWINVVFVNNGVIGSKIYDKRAVLQFENVKVSTKVTLFVSMK